VDTRLGQVHVRELGEGPPLVLLHKTPSSSIMFSRVLPMLAAGRRVIAFDTPGYGRSERPAEQPREIADYAAAIVDALDGLGLEAPDVAGFYTGAVIALEIAAGWPERVRRLVLSGLVAGDGSSELHDYIVSLGHMRDSIEIDAEGRFLEEYPLAWLRGYVAHDGEQYLLEMIAYLECAPSYWWAYQAAERHVGRERLAHVRAPTLVLNPIDGLPYMVEQTRRVHEAMPGSAYREIPGSTEVCMEDPATWANAVREFVDADATADR
jgi:pimeloyl-ACP methyl ester carboxylesterase